MKTRPRPKLTLQQLANAMPDAEYKSAVAVAGQWERWMSDPLRYDAPSRAANASALYEHKSRGDASFDVTVNRAKWHLREIDRERKADPMPGGFRDNLGERMMWQTREDDRKAREQRWQVYLP